MKAFFFISFLLFAVTGIAQNNPIFSGGGNDGWNRSSYQQSLNNVYVGGSGDGWSRSAYQQTINNIFSGGEADGWNYRAYRQAANNIYNGGEGDGWSFRAYQQPVNNVYVGGIGDGWNFNAYLPSQNNIYPGGQGDGWASVYRPLGILPVTLLTFTAQKQAANALLKWETSAEINAASFDVERSADAIYFTKVGNVLATGNATTKTAYTFVDRSPVKGYNHYRLKQLDRNGTFVYTPTRSVLFNAASLQGIKAYPVPATSLVTVEIPAALQNVDVVMNLWNSGGVMVQQVKLSRGRIGDKRILDLTSLPAGVYTLQVVSAGFNGAQVIIKQ